MDRQAAHIHTQQGTLQQQRHTRAQQPRPSPNTHHPPACTRILHNATHWVHSPEELNTTLCHALHLRVWEFQTQCKHTLSECKSLPAGDAAAAAPSVDNHTTDERPLLACGVTTRLVAGNSSQGPQHCTCSTLHTRIRLDVGPWEPGLTRACWPLHCQRLQGSTK